MENKINIAELLKDCPKGMKLDCSIWDNVVFDHVDMKSDYPICIKKMGGKIEYLTEYGCFNFDCGAKCVIFPKGKTTWEGFQRPFKDGDVVMWKDRGSLIAFIYKERKNVAVVKYHFALYTGGLGALTEGEIALVESELIFATEEEKQKLFDAIKANGYKWNPETKTLEEVEQKFKVGDRIWMKENHNYIYTITGIRKKENKYECGVTFVLRFSEQDNWELVPNKFDITTLKPFDKVLVRHNKGWCLECNFLFSLR